MWSRGDRSQVATSHLVTVFLIYKKNEIQNMAVSVNHVAVATNKDTRWFWSCGQRVGLIYLKLWVFEGPTDNQSFSKITYCPFRIRLLSKVHRELCCYSKVVGQWDEIAAYPSVSVRPRHSQQLNDDTFRRRELERKKIFYYSNYPTSYIFFPSPSSACTCSVRKILSMFPGLHETGSV